MYGSACIIGFIVCMVPRALSDKFDRFRLGTGGMPPH